MADPKARVLEIEKELDAVFWELLGPLRKEKRVDPDVFHKFCMSLDELITLIQDWKEARERVVSFLYLVYEVLLAESKTAPQPEEILGQAKKLQTRLEKLWSKL
jgi:hypothetical protein